MSNQRDGLLVTKVFRFYVLLLGVFASGGLGNPPSPELEMQAVRILLECFLVFMQFSAKFGLAPTSGKSWIRRFSHAIFMMIFITTLPTRPNVKRPLWDGFYPAPQPF